MLTVRLTLFCLHFVRGRYHYVVELVNLSLTLVLTGERSLSYLRLLAGPVIAVWW